MQTRLHLFRTVVLLKLLIVIFSLLSEKVRMCWVSGIDIH